MVKAAWTEVTPTCVRNCFCKAGCVHLEPDADPEASEDDQSGSDLWQCVDSNVGGHDIGWDDFISADDAADTAQPYTDKGIVMSRAVCLLARQTGYQSYLLTTSLVGESRSVGKAMAQLAFYLCYGGSMVPVAHDPVTEIAQHLQVRYRELEQLKESAERAFDMGRPICVVTAGETTVNVTGPGKGGRCQELALAAAIELDRLFNRAELQPQRAELVVLAAGTLSSAGCAAPLPL
ncbi:hypothetical protein HPB50_004566 [Hyalomma asiaticum]|uniref:Uncharacterized protein n=1 Tax=Hyalomma asiaticum TaxID=266040 RepID=A0ACB7S1H5_HYAAI|nr:hypothetical protein HPB50_004566 [Hyalomma asiaticum]